MFKIQVACGVAIGTCLFATSVWSAPPPASAFGRLPSVHDAEISPDGTHIAFLGGSANDRVLTIAPVDGAKAAIVHTGKAETYGIRWIGDSYVSISTTIYDRREYSEATHAFHYNRDFLIALDGKPVGPLFKPKSNVANYGLSQPVLRVVGDEKPEVVLMAPELTPGAFIPESTSHIKKADTGVAFALWRVVPAGEARVQELGSPNTRAWALDAEGIARVRIDVDATANRWRVFARSKSKTAWQLLSDQPHFKHDDVLGYSDQEDAVYIGRTDGSRYGVYRALLTDKSETLVKESPESDFDLVFDPYKLQPIGFRHGLEKQVVDWTDPAFASAQKVLDRAFPGQHVRIINWSRSRNRYLAKADSPDVAPVWYLYDVPAKQISPVGEPYPELAGLSLGSTRWVTYKAKDGLDIHAYLTLPPGAHEPSGLPLVVLPHGGPASRDAYEFDYLTQFLATRGYAVLRPQFRGSTGFGEAFQAAGDKEWGGKMQTDLTDGVDFLASQGMVDRQRVCIVGWSYGGYAALAGAAFHPETYRCSVSINGVSDLKEMIGSEVHDFGTDSFTLDYWRKLIGDVRTENAAVIAASPARNISNVKGPILLVHGRKDTVVPYYQSEVMQKALMAAGKPVQLVTFEDDDHYLLNSKNRIEMLEAVGAFLRANNPA